MTVGVVNPGGTDVGRTVVEDKVGLPVVHVGSEGSPAVGGGDVGDEGGA